MQFWIGFYKKEKKRLGEIYFIDGSYMSYTNWLWYEPDSSSLCGAMDLNNFWFESPCYSTSLSFICKLPKFTQSWFSLQTFREKI